MTDRFLQEKLDTKRYVLLNLKKIWWLMIGAVVGAVLFGVIYYLKTDVLAPEPLYRSQVLYEITFDRDQVDNIHDYYNDYTWNDILDSDQIAGRAASILGDMDKEAVAEAVSIPTMSDIRFIWVYADMESGADAERIQTAIGKALEEFAAATDGFTSITVWDTKEVGQIQHHSLIVRMTVAGAVIGALIALFFICYSSAMDDSVYTESDIKEKLDILPAGVIMKNPEKQPEFFKKELYENLKNILKDAIDTSKPAKIGIAVVSENIAANKIAATGDNNTAGRKESAEENTDLTGAWNYLEKLLVRMENKVLTVTSSPESYETLKNMDAWILVVPYGKKNGKQLELLWKNYQIQKCLPAAVVIAGADERFYRLYYGAGRKAGTREK